jgi:hypothetical protein
MRVEVTTGEKIFALYLTERELAIITNWGRDSQDHYLFFSELADLCEEHDVDRCKVKLCG